LVLADSLRRQLLLDEQRLLYDAWSVLARGRIGPSRRELDPTCFTPLLPRIALLDVCAEGRFRYRLAGTALRAAFGCDPTGAYLDEIAPATAPENWRRAHALVVQEGRPRCGAAAPLGGESGVLLWLRLPLSESGDAVTGILAYDHPVSAGEAQMILSRSAAA
jgi:hypothetical protein